MDEQLLESYEMFKRALTDIANSRDWAYAVDQVCSIEDCFEYVVNVANQALKGYYEED